MNWYLKALKQYTDFEGRARRTEYWMFVLINFLVSLVFYVLGMILTIFTFLGGLYGLAVLIPSIAVGVRRLHDTNRSGWWLLVAFIPLIGAIVLIIFFVQDSDSGNNQYGPSPK